MKKSMKEKIESNSLDLIILKTNQISKKVKAHLGILI